MRYLMYYINPQAWAFKSAAINEFWNRTFESPPLPNVTLPFFPGNISMADLPALEKQYNMTFDLFEAPTYHTMLDEIGITAEQEHQKWIFFS